MKFTREQYDEIVLTLENEADFHRQYTRGGKTVGERRILIQSWLGPAYNSWDAARQHIKLSFRTSHNDIEDREQIRRYFDARYDIPCVCTKYTYLPSVWDDPKPALAPHHEAFIQKVIDAGGAAKWLATTHKGGYTASLANYHGCPLTIHDMKPVLAALERACLDATRPEAKKSAQRIDTLLDDIAAELTPAFTPAPTPKETSVSKPLTITAITYANGADISKMTDSEIFNLIAEQEAEIEALKKIKAQPKKLVEEIAKREAGIVALVAYLDNAKA